MEEFGAFVGFDHGCVILIIKWKVHVFITELAIIINFLLYICSFLLILLPVSVSLHSLGRCEPLPFSR